MSRRLMTALPDLVASGRSPISLAVPGSTIYRQHPGSVVGTAGFAGSGTSFSAAIVSGAAALILSAHPGISPGEVKAVCSARPARARPATRSSTATAPWTPRPPPPPGPSTWSSRRRAC